jgi:hypothetical protein
MSNKLLFEAIALKKCIEATYNRTVMRLAPHILYTRHGEVYLDAVALLKEGRAPREIKLGTFKVAGLNELLLTEEPFDALHVFEPEAEKYEGVTLFAIEP